MCDLYAGRFHNSAYNETYCLLLHKVSVIVLCRYIFIIVHMMLCLRLTVWVGVWAEGGWGDVCACENPGTADSQTLCYRLNTVEGEYNRDGGVSLCILLIPVSIDCSYHVDIKEVNMNKI